MYFGRDLRFCLYSHRYYYIKQKEANTPKVFASFCFLLLYSLSFSAFFTVDLGQSPMRGLTVLFVHILSGLIHGSNYIIKGYLSCLI